VVMVSCIDLTAFLEYVTRNVCPGRSLRRLSS
jgi:hypothetical protein